MPEKEIFTSKRMKYNYFCCSPEKFKAFFDSPMVIIKIFGYKLCCLIFIFCYVSAVYLSEITGYTVSKSSIKRGC